MTRRGTALPMVSQPDMPSASSAEKLGYLELSFQLLEMIDFPAN